MEFQANLFDTAVAPSVGSLAATRRTPLRRGAWVDVRPNWIGGADPRREGAVLGDSPR